MVKASVTSGGIQDKYWSSSIAIESTKFQLYIQADLVMLDTFCQNGKIVCTLVKVSVVHMIFFLKQGLEMHTRGNDEIG